MHNVLTVHAMRWFSMRHVPSTLLIVVLLLSHPFLSAQPTVNSISFRGNEYFSQRELLQELPLQMKAVYSAEKLAASVRALTDRYRNEGFFLAGVDSVARRYSGDSSAVELEFCITEGVRSVLREFRIHGSTLFTDRQIYLTFETRAGSPLSQATLEKDIDDLLVRYEENGYPFSRIVVDSVAVDTLASRDISFVLEITEGARVYLDEIRVEGNTSTRADVITREAYLQPHELYRQKKIDHIRRRLERIGIFTSVGEPQLYLLHEPGATDSVSGGLSLTVHEGNTNNFDGIAGYVPPPTEGKGGYVTGNVFVSMRNLFGTGRKAVVRWQRENEFSQELEASYVEPWVAGYPVNAGAGIFQRKQDSTYIKTRLDLHADVNLTTDLAIVLSLDQESVYPSADLDYFTVFESSILSFGGEVRYDTRDNLRSPTSGINYATAYSRGTKKITGPAAYLSYAEEKNFVVEKLSVDVEQYLSLFTKQVLVSGFHGRKVTSSRLEQSDLYQLGGINTVRGYRENQFYGSQVVWANLEYRFLTGRFSSVFGFVDAGYFYRPEDTLRHISSQEKFLYGYGVGARIETGLGIFRVSYALGEGDGFSAGKIHFGIANEF